ncbi:MAG: hypothetical protein KME57_19605 [Scytonema hyalinum WJT4-NPBG1]|nr:hypothetical protein [Scytonema hyalinum WJT4-NPBG1]
MPSARYANASRLRRETRLQRWTHRKRGGELWRSHSSGWGFPGFVGN